jgi:uncharacterized membrane protein
MPAIITRLFESTAHVIEIVGVSVLVMGFLICLGRYLRHYSHMDNFDLVKEFKSGLGRAVLIGLEILVAASIIKTATVKPTLVSVGLLGGMIAVRTILGWTTTLEIDGHWPWQSLPRMREGTSNSG